MLSQATKDCIEADLQKHFRKAGAGGLKALNLAGIIAFIETLLPAIIALLTTAPPAPTPVPPVTPAP
jgi:hypothetical protein